MMLGLLFIFTNLHYNSSLYQFMGCIIPAALIRMDNLNYPFSKLNMVLMNLSIRKEFLQGLWSLQNVLEFVNDTIREKKSGSTLFNFKTYCISTFLRISSAGIDFRTP